MTDDPVAAVPVAHHGGDISVVGPGDDEVTSGRPG
jgi:hypothetical protein